jgi:transcriptional regulator with XRE-family HTH domain
VANPEITLAASFENQLLGGHVTQDEQQAFGEMLRNARRGRRVSQAALAKAVGISAVFVSQIETGQRVPSDRVAKDLATALGLPWQDTVKAVYRLRSPEASELFPVGDNEGPAKSVSDIPAVRFLLLQLAGLNLSRSDVEVLIRNWSNDLALITQLAKVQDR